MRHLALAGALALACLIAGPAEACGRHFVCHASGARSSMVALVSAAARRHGVPLALQLAIVQTESGFDPRARNGRSIGLGQIQGPTARDAGCRGSLADPAANADCSARILATLLRDARGDWHRAAARYNAGRYAHGSAGARYASLILSRARRRPV